MGFFDLLFGKKKASPAPAPTQPAAPTLTTLLQDHSGQESRNDLSSSSRQWEKHMNSLTPQTRMLVGYELAKKGASTGKSGFHHGKKGGIPMPFAFCGWAVCKKAGIDWDGLAFRIEKGCFGDREPLLYYTDNDNWLEGDAGALCKAIASLSSGIADLRVEPYTPAGSNVTKNRLLFRLDSTALRSDVVLYDTDEAPEGYILVLPRCGEFLCQLGEILNGQMIPLHNDDYCMK